MNDGSSQAAAAAIDQRRQEDERLEKLGKLLEPTARLPKASAIPALKRVDRIEDFDRRIVATAIRNAVTKAIVHIAGRSPELATERDVQIEQLLLDTLLKEINPEVDYSGGKQSIEQRQG